MEINELAREIHLNAKNKGFWDKPRENGTLLMLCVSELSEALEADRKNKYSIPKVFKQAVLNVDEDDVYWKQEFEVYIKDTFEDELADALIRILDLAESKGIDLEWHVKQKMKYNSTRDKMHGKLY
jgi:NTP pyrophosphatase (non-canonical NTP hydrolase)